MKGYINLNMKYFYIYDTKNVLYGYLDRQIYLCIRSGVFKAKGANGHNYWEKKTKIRISVLFSHKIDVVNYLYG